METDRIQEISRLRSLNLSPKQIARNLNMRPAEVSEILRQQAATLDLERAARGEVNPLYKLCGKCFCHDDATRSRCTHERDRAYWIRASIYHTARSTAIICL
jgi:hypothetical protein